MNCERTESLMMDFLYGEISEKMPGGFFEHLDECERCSAHLQDLRYLRSLIKEIPVVTNPSSVWKYPPWINHSRRSLSKWYWATAAIIILAVFLLFAVLNTSFQYKQGVITLRFGSDREPVTQELAVSFPDHELSSQEVEGLVQYITYLENRRNAEQVILTDQFENLANSTLNEFRKRDEMLQWLINNYALRSGQLQGQILPTSQEER